MAKHKVGFDDYEEKDGAVYSGDEPKNGIYDAVLSGFQEHSTSDTAMRWSFDITEEPYEGWRGYLYSDLANGKWKTQQIVKAIQGGEEKEMVLDTDKGDALIKKAKPVRVRIKSEQYEGERKAKIGTVLVKDGGASASGKKGKKSKKGDDPWED